MKARINVTSVGGQITREHLAEIARTAPSVAIYDMKTRREVGRTLSYDWQPPDVWAEVEIEDDVVNIAGLKAASALVFSEGRLRLLAVMLTTMPRELIRTVGSGMSYDEAVAKIKADRGRPS